MPPRIVMRIFSYYLMLTAVVCGGLVMLIELLGSRVIGPFFGVGLFVWTSLITVALVALALGYTVGGRLSDQKADPAWLYGFIMFSGLLTLLIPLLQTSVLQMCQPLGLRLGTLLASTLLFGPPLFLLGFVSPYVVKIAARELTDIGQTVGRFYALSTVGSGLGTLVTGFVLIPWLGVRGIFYVAGTTLILLGVGYFVFFAKKRQALVALLIPLFMLPGAKPIQSELADSTQVNVVAAEESYYGSLKVLDYRYGELAIRELTIDGLIQGGIDITDGTSIYGYPYLLKMLPRMLNPNGKTALMIGVGAGIVPRWYSAQGVLTDVVDIDPKVVELANRYFDFKTSGEIYIQDARYFLVNTTKRYDYLLLDVFSGDTTPGHVLSTEAIKLLAERITDKGVVAVNLVGDLGNDTRVAQSLVKSFRQHFQQVDIYPLFKVSKEVSTGNYVLLAYNGKAVDITTKDKPIAAFNHFVKDEVEFALQQKFELQITSQAMILSDEYNPIEFLDAQTREQVRRDILKNSRVELLL